MFLGGYLPTPVLAQPASTSSSTAKNGILIDLSTPEKTLASFAATIVQGDWDNAVRCVVGASTSELTAQFKTDPKMPFSDIIIKQLVVTPSGDQLVRVHCVPNLVMVNGTEGTPAPPETLSLRRSEAGWQIVPVGRAVFHPGKEGIFTDLSFLLANPDVGLAARKKAKEVAQGEEGIKQLESLVANPPGLEVGKIARLYRDAKRSTIYAAQDLTNEEAFASYLALRELRSDRDLPFSKATDGFTDADVNQALATAKSTADRLKASGAVFFLSHGTRGRIVAYVPPRPLRENLLSTQNELQTAQHPSGNFKGIWQVEILDGVAKGKTVWTYNLADMEPNLGDYVTLNIPDHTNARVPGAIDPEAGRVLNPTGKPVSGKAATQFERLLREKRVFLFPAGFRCVVEDRMTDGSLVLINPLSGTEKGKTFFVCPDDVNLVP